MSAAANATKLGTGAAADPIERWAPIAAALLTIVAVVLRLPELGSRSLWLDEAWRANLALAPTWQAFWSGVLGGEHVEAPLAPLYALVLRVVGLAAGRSPGVLRASSLVPSVAAVPLAFVLGRRVYGPIAGVAAAVAFACYRAAITFGRELKPYALDVAVVLIVLLLASAVVRRRDVASWVRWTVASALVPGFSYPAVIVLPALAVALLVASRDRRDVTRWAIAMGVAVGAALAWYALVIAPQRARPVNVAYWSATFPTLDRAGAALLAAAAVELCAFTLGMAWWLVAPMVGGGWLVAPRWFTIAGVATLATVVVAGFARVYPLSGGRTSLFLLPLIYVPFGAAVAWLLRRPRGPVLLRVSTATLAVVLVTLPIVAPADPNAGLVYEETAPLVATLRTERKPGDRVYVYYGAVPAFTFYHPDLDAGVTLGTSHRDDVAAYEAELKPLLAPGERLWLVFAHVFPAASGGDERDAILEKLGLYGKQIQEWKTRGASLELYAIERAADRVRHLVISPEDAANPERLRELLRK